MFYLPRFGANISHVAFQFVLSELKLHIWGTKIAVLHGICNILVFTNLIMVFNDVWISWWSSMVFPWFQIFCEISLKALRFLRGTFQASLGFHLRLLYGVVFGFFGMPFRIDLGSLQVLICFCFSFFGFLKVVCHLRFLEGDVFGFLKMSLNILLGSLLGFNIKVSADFVYGSFAVFVRVAWKGLLFCVFH